MTKLQTFAVTYPKFTSGIHTFLATFIVTIVGLLYAIPVSSIFSPDTWTTSAIIAILVSALRAAIKAVSPLVVPLLTGITTTTTQTTVVN